MLTASNDKSLFIDNKRFLYENGLPFDTTLSFNLDEQKKRVERNKASLIIVDGQQGEGKTTLACHAVSYMQGKPIDLDKQLAYGGAEFQEKLQLCIDAGLHYIIYDEAGDYSRKGSLTKFNKDLDRVFETYRTYRIIVVMVLPLFSVLDNSLFDKGIPRMLLNCYGRNNYGNYRVYGIAEMAYLRHYMDKEIVKMKAYQKVTPNFRGHFLDLVPEVSRALDILSTTKKKDILSESVLRNRGLRSAEQIAKDYNMTKVTINRFLKELNAKPVSIYKRARYYDSDTLARIDAKIDNKKRG
jgi:hypothetical protein